MRILQPARRGNKLKSGLSESATVKPALNDLSARPIERSRAAATNVQDNCSVSSSALELNSAICELAPGKKRRRSELEHLGMQNGVQATKESETPLELVVDPAKKEFNELFARGVRLLAMREHSVKEITKKLLDKSDKSDLVHAVVDELLDNKYLSDERFTESYVRARSNRGFGPVKIRSELNSKGVSSVLIQEHLSDSAGFWLDIAATQYQKKYGDTPVSDYNTWTKRARFMQSRGFTMEHIHVTLPPVEFD